MTVRLSIKRLDFDETAGKLMNGSWVAYPYETYGQLDRDEWNDQLLKELARRGVTADIIDIPKKSVAVLINTDWQPTFEQVVNGVSAIEYDRAMGH